MLSEVADYRGWPTTRGVDLFVSVCIPFISFSSLSSPLFNLKVWPRHVVRGLNKTRFIAKTINT